MGGDDGCVTPEAVELVRRSLAQATVDPIALADCFRVRLAQQSPEAAALFGTELVRHHAAFAPALVGLVASLDHVEDLVHLGGELGSAHAAYGVRTGHVRAGVEALVAAIDDTIGGIDDATKEAWRLAGNLVAETMARGVAAPRMPTLPDQWSSTPSNA